MMDNFLTLCAMYYNTYYAWSILNETRFVLYGHYYSIAGRCTVCTSNFYV
jgi:hypothetical protein